jgi:acetylornithine deacetylase/succinyl-diaminopimelate desuccinylase-like protein
VLGLAAPRPDGALTTGCPGSARVLLRVGGAAADARDGGGVSATEELLDQLATLRAAVPPSGVALNVGRIGGGTEAYAVADLAGAEFGLRFDDAGAEREMLAAIGALRAVRAGAQVHAESLSRLPAWPPPRENPLLDWVAAIGERHGLAVLGGPGGRSGDTNHAGAHGAPTLDGFGGVGVRLHGAGGADERVRVESLVPRAVLLAALLAHPLPPVAARRFA